MQTIFDNYDVRDKAFWKAEREAGKTLVKFIGEKYKNGDKSGGNELLQRLEEMRIREATARKEATIARKYIKMLEEDWENFRQYWDN